MSWRSITRTSHNNKSIELTDAGVDARRITGQLKTLLSLRVSRVFLRNVQSVMYSGRTEEGKAYCCSSRQEHQCLLWDILPDMLFTEHWLFFLFLFGPSSHLEKERKRRGLVLVHATKMAHGKSLLWFDGCNSPWNHFIFLTSTHSAPSASTTWQPCHSDSRKWGSK